MNRYAHLTLLAVTALVVPAFASGQAPAWDRLPPELLDMAAPSEWIRGQPGSMSVVRRECRVLPAAEVRNRIVDAAVQEWAFFGFPVLDRMNGARLLPPGSALDPNRPYFENTTRRAPVLDARESARVAATIAGYWAVTPEGPGIVGTQNRAWSGRGLGIRWNSPWSAAFISWVMCEAGLGTTDRFHRAIAHWRYIDQAIRARDGQASGAAFVAHEIGEEAVQPGDMLCAARRPAYRNLSQRRRQMGTGARTHCDIVVEVDLEGERILAIGGNVLRSVSLKVLAGQRTAQGTLVARSTPGAPLFAHLKLRSDPVASAGLTSSPAMAHLACRSGDGEFLRPAFVFGELGLPLPRGEAC